MKGDYFEVSLSCRRRSPRIPSALIDWVKQCGVPRSQIVETMESGQSQIRIYFSARKAAEIFLTRHKKSKLSGVTARCKQIVYADWAEKWKEDYRIQKIGRRFVVIPAWRRKQFKSRLYPGRIPVVMDPLSAFGSGEHETTRLVTRLMETLKGRFASFLDVGTGTGILSIFAAHLGAFRIFGFDCDKPSAACARFNFEKNILFPTTADFRCLELARLNSEREFDLVAANINSHILENFRREIVRSAKKGGWVLVSGILRQTYDSFRGNFDGQDLRCVKILRGRRWVSVLYRKR